MTCRAGIIGFAALFGVMGTSLEAQVRNCQIEIRSQFDIDSQEMQRFLRCLNARISDLYIVQRRLERRVEELESLAGDLPAAWSNADGVITEVAGRPIGSASFLLSSRTTGGANALAIDQQVLEEICGASSGCTMTIGLNQLTLFDRSPRNSVVSGPCQFSYTPGSGAWAVSAGCGGGAQSGIDGDGKLGGAADNSAEIAEAGGACILADSGLARDIGSDDTLAADRSRGLFLIAMPSRQENGQRRFQCELKLQ